MTQPAETPARIGEPKISFADILRAITDAAAAGLPVDDLLKAAQRGRNYHHPYYTLAEEVAEMNAAARRNGLKVIKKSEDYEEDDEETGELRRWADVGYHW